MVKKLSSIGITHDGPVFIIAEAGVNHNGSLDKALRLVSEATRCGADCIKFQTFQAERVARRDAPKAAYQLRVTDPAESQVDMLRALELSRNQHLALMAACRENGIRFLSTPYDLGDAEMLASLGVDGFKLASIHIVEIGFLRGLAEFGLPLIVSTGMATLGEVDTAVRTLRACGHEEFVVLQCTTNYPSRIADANLRAMVSMGTALGVSIGYSDHTEGIAAPLAAVALGARVIEKHFTLDRSLPGPDHSCSSEPAELAHLVRGIREVEQALGSPIKAPTAAELENIRGMRRSIVARAHLRAGDRIRAEHLICKRPGDGIPPARVDELIGRTLVVDVPPDTPLEWQHVR
jgi:N-acetylneuraminate synthase/N,N'-diacetyllegionaminate synthase